MSASPVLVIDSCSDLTASMVDHLDVEVLHFPFTLDGQERLDDFGKTLPHRDFFARMRDGATPTTAQIPRTELERVFSQAAASGRPLVYFGFSSELSSTFDSAHLARDAVLEQFPSADIRLVDTHSASIAEGLFVHEAATRHADGATADELVAWAEENKLRVNGYFTLENLESLRRGGRISDAAAAAGTMLDIKPLLTLDRDGKLVLKKSIRGRKKSLAALVDIVGERRDAAVGETVAIGHADAPEEAEYIRSVIEERWAPAEVLMLEIGPVIGAHVGPGMVAVSFWGAERP
ncbi:MAG: DegV family protein [Coriobacteriales bacterium]|nr:DegV family protein [Actinomycetes bacterium]